MARNEELDDDLDSLEGLVELNEEGKYGKE